MHDPRLGVLLVAIGLVPALSAQYAGDAPGVGVVADVGTDCDTFARAAKEFLSNRGLKVSMGFGTTYEDWACGAPGYRCIMFGSARPRAADGRALSRSDVVRDYLKDPATADFRWKNLTHGYWAAPDSNFRMGAWLQLKTEGAGCSAKLSMGLGMGGMVVLGIIPYDLYTWPIPPDNGRLQADYMAAIVKTLQH